MFYKEASVLENWIMSETETEKRLERTVKDCCRYTAKQDLNVFLTRSYLEKFIEGEIADDSEFTLYTTKNRDCSWLFKGKYLLHEFVINLFISYGRNNHREKPNPCVAIDVSLDYENSQSAGCWDSFINKIETFLKHGYHSHSEFTTPTEISVESVFCRHDGGEGYLHISYDCNRAEPMNLHSAWYSPLDMVPPWGVEQEMLADYLRRIKQLEIYH
jgi:hypothetical protein